MRSPCRFVCVAALSLLAGGVAAADPPSLVEGRWLRLEGPYLGARAGKTRTQLAFFPTKAPQPGQLVPPPPKDAPVHACRYAWLLPNFPNAATPPAVWVPDPFGDPSWVLLPVAFSALPMTPPAYPAPSPPSPGKREFYCDKSGQANVVAERPAATRVAKGSWVHVVVPQDRGGAQIFVATDPVEEGDKLPEAPDKLPRYNCTSLQRVLAVTEQGSDEAPKRPYGEWIPSPSSPGHWAWVPSATWPYRLHPTSSPTTASPADTQSGCAIDTDPGPAKRCIKYKGTGKKQTCVRWSS